MNLAQKLRRIFGLAPSATDAQLLAEAARCRAIADDHASRAEEDSVINNLINESGGALDRKRALEVIRTRGGFAALRRKKA